VSSRSTRNARPANTPGGLERCHADCWVNQMRDSRAPERQPTCSSGLVYRSACEASAHAGRAFGLDSLASETHQRRGATRQEPGGGHGGGHIHLQLQYDHDNPVGQSAAVSSDQAISAVDFNVCLPLHTHSKL
jgi:hypothetical protein